MSGSGMQKDCKKYFDKYLYTEKFVFHVTDPCIDSGNIPSGVYLEVELLFFQKCLESVLKRADG